jgi:hypothetical protein
MTQVAADFQPGERLRRLDLETRGGRGVGEARRLRLHPELGPKAKILVSPLDPKFARVLSSAQPAQIPDRN